MKKILLTFALLIFCLLPAYSLSDTTSPGAINTTPHLSYTPSPSKSLLYSAFIPAGGQIYNKSYIKAMAFIYLDALCIEKIVYYNKKMNSIPIFDEPTYTEEKKYEDYYERRQKYYGWLVFSVLYSMMDAYVEAKLFNFEKEKQRIRMNFDQDYLGLSYTF